MKLQQNTKYQRPSQEISILFLQTNQYSDIFLIITILQSLLL